MSAYGSNFCTLSSLSRSRSRVTMLGTPVPPVPSVCWLQVAADADGWVDLSILMSFARMKKLTSNAAGVAEAVRKSSSVVEVAEDGKRVRRKSPLPASTNFIDSSVYAKGFPKTGTSLDEVETAFAKFGDVGRVTFRKFKDGNFKVGTHSPPNQNNSKASDPLCLFYSFVSLTRFAATGLCVC